MPALGAGFFPPDEANLWEDPRLVVVETIKRTGKVIQSLDRELANALRYQRLKDELAALSGKLAGLQRVDWFALAVAVLSIWVATR